jgi:hypothetical protein
LSRYLSGPGASSTCFVSERLRSKSGAAAFTAGKVRVARIHARCGIAAILLITRARERVSIVRDGCVRSEGGGEDDEQVQQWTCTEPFSCESYHFSPKCVTFLNL